MFDLSNWYWLADDGRVFASKRQVIVDDTDPEYLAWGQSPTTWPRDDEGAQTNAALQEVLRPLGIYVDLTYYTAAARQKRIASDITVNGLPFSTDPLTYGSLNSAYIYTQSNVGAVFSWKLPDGSFITLSKADIDALQATANSFAQACFACEDTTLDGITAGTITTREQVDASFAAISNTFTGLQELAVQSRRHQRK